MKSEVDLGILVEPTTEGDPLVVVVVVIETLLLLTLADNEGMDVDILFDTGGTGVALGERVFLIVVLPLALEVALGFEVDIDDEQIVEGTCSTVLSAFAVIFRAFIKTDVRTSPKLNLGARYTRQNYQ